MAFNWKTFQTRALTAIIFAAIMLGGLLLSKWSFFLLFSVIHFGCWWEYFNLIEKIHTSTININSRLGFMLMGYAVITRVCDEYYQIGGYTVSDNLPLILSIAGFILLGIGILTSRKVKAATFASAAFGWIYISLAWALMIDLGNNESVTIGDITYALKWWYIPLFMIVCIWINDTMAYIVGSMIGRTPLSKISPKKTWEGTIGGILLAVAAVIITSVLIYVNIKASLHIGILALLIAITGTIGDLFQSKLKRMANVKDSGNIMPGHGGFLDRFDSLLFATPFVWLYFYVLYNF